MPWIYCGTDQQVDATNTQDLLIAQDAIWCPPPIRNPWPGNPVGGEPLWLVWRAVNGGPVLLLGAGIILAAPRHLFQTEILWTNPDMPGMRQYAQGLGYAGPTNMAFLRLHRIVYPPKVKSLQGIGELAGGLNVATPAQVEILRQELPIE